MRVRIYRPTKSTMQSGRARTHAWVLEPELLTARKPEPLMGWLSSGDTYSEMRDRLRFPNADEAVSFARRNGWEFILEEPAERHIPPRNYLDNFRIVRPEDEERQKLEVRSQKPES